MKLRVAEKRGHLKTREGQGGIPIDLCIVLRWAVSMHRTLLSWQPKCRFCRQTCPRSHPRSRWCIWNFWCFLYLVFGIIFDIWHYILFSQTLHIILHLPWNVLRNHTVLVLPNMSYLKSRGPSSFALFGRPSQMDPHHQNHLIILLSTAGYRGQVRQRNRGIFMMGRQEQQELRILVGWLELLPRHKTSKRRNPKQM